MEGSLVLKERMLVVVPIFVLMLEDNADDAELILNQLHVAGFELDCVRVETQGEYLQHLSPGLDLIIADYRLPTFDGLTAMHLLKERGLDIPFILVSGSIGEERAVAAMRDGASDYLLKDRLGRLGPAVARALEQKRLRLEKQAADAQITKREQRFRGLIEYAADAIALVDSEGRLLYTSPSTFRILGYNDTEITGEFPGQLTHPDDKIVVREKITELHKKPGSSVTLQFRILHRDASWRWLESTITNLLAESSVEAIVFNYRDITENKQAAQALIESETRHRALIEHNADAILLLDEQLIIQYGSPASERVLGAPLGELVGRNALSGLHTDDIELVDPILGQVLEHPGISYPLTLRYRHPDGSYHSIEATITNLLHDPSVHAIVSNYRDVSLRKKAEESEREQRTLAEALRDSAAALNSTLDFETVLEQILVNAGRVVPHDASTIMLLEDNEAHVVGSRGYSAEGATKIEALRLPLSRARNLREMVETGMPVIVPDVRLDPHWLQTAVVEQQRASLGAPIRHKARTIGFICLDSYTPNAFTTANAKYLMAFSDQAAIALENARLFRETERQLDRLASLRVVEQAISGSFDLGITLHVLLDQVTSRLKVDAATIFLVNPWTNMLEIGASRGFRSTGLGLAPVRMGESLAGKVASGRKAWNIPNMEDLLRAAGRNGLVSAEGFAAYYGVPLVSKGAVIGVLELYQRTSRPERPEWIDFVQAIAGQAAIAIDNASLFQDLQKSNLQLVVAYDATIEGWSRALDLRDKETKGHTQRVTELSLRLARAAGIGTDDLIHLRRGALLHDIGKMGVPDNILLKPGPLTAEEWVVMRNHPTLAYEMLYPIVYLRPALDIPYCHHEKMNGTGYPRGLKGQEIPLAARVFAPVDVWDALRSDRPYRAAWSAGKTREFMKTQSGTHFDPAILELFLNMEEVKTSSGEIKGNESERDETNQDS